MFENDLLVVKTPNIKSIAAGSTYTLGLKKDGTVKATKWNDGGRFNVSGWKNIVGLSAGNHHAVGLKSDGTAVATGRNYHGECDVEDWKEVQALAAGKYHTVCLKTDGTVEAIGNNSYGQCNVSDWKNIVAIDAGDFYTVGLQSDGTVVATGNNSYGQCDVSDWKDIVAVRTGSFHTIGLQSDGTVVATGNNEYGQCDVSDWKDMFDIAAGGWHTVGLKTDGTVEATGNNEYGQCNVSDWADIVFVDAGDYHTVGLKSDGTVVAKGMDKNGQCGVDDWEGIIVPEEESDEDDTNETDETENSDVDYASIESYLVNHANHFVGADMPFYGDGKNIYFSDGPYNPTGVYSFSKKTGSCIKVIDLPKAAQSEVNYVSFYEKGFGLKTINRNSSEYEKIQVYNYNGEKTASNANIYTAGYDGENVYFINYEDGMVECVAAEGKVWNSSFIFDSSITQYNGCSIGNIYTYQSHLFIELFYQNQWILITDIEGEYKKLADLGEKSIQYVDDNILYYISNNILYKLQIAKSEVHPEKVCEMEANCHIYFVCNSRIYYGKFIDSVDAEYNGDINVIYYKEINGNPVKLYESGYPIGGI
ncbi:MAG: hypothetical protein IKE65_10365 [Clostridia bacterium]|nr:hypothetical protein [Clostridia bacterium]